MSRYGPASDLPDLEADLPTTAEDVRVLRHLRRTARAGTSLKRLDELRLPSWLLGDRLDATSEGWEPFEL